MNTIINTKIDNNSYGVLNAFQVSLIANISSNELSKIVYNTSSDYILTRTFNYISSVDEFFQFLDEHWYFQNIDDVMNISCPNIARLNDHLLKKDLI